MFGAAVHVLFLLLARTGVVPHSYVLSAAVRTRFLLLTWPVLGAADGIVCLQFLMFLVVPP